MAHFRVRDDPLRSQQWAGANYIQLFHELTETGGHVFHHSLAFFRQRAARVVLASRGGCGVLGDPMPDDK